MKQRITELLAMNKLPTPINILKHLRKLNKDDGKIGFYEWHKKYPKRCLPLPESSEPAEVSESVGNPNIIRPLF